MSIQTCECRPEFVRGFVLETLNAVELDTFEQHLEHCPTCQKEIRLQSADADVWDKAGLYLRDQHDDLCPLSDLSIVAEEHSHQHSVAARVLDALAPTDDPSKLGRLGSYEISGVVGSGGMGAVLKGLDPALNRVVAIKVMAPHLASSGAARRRFAREAQATAAITHEIPSSTSSCVILISVVVRKPD